jgi:hypothetical protein
LFFYVSWLTNTFTGARSYLASVLEPVSFPLIGLTQYLVIRHVAGLTPGELLGTKKTASPYWLDKIVERLHNSTNNIFLVSAVRLRKLTFGNNR